MRLIANHLSSTIVIHNLMDSDATTEDEQPQVDNIEKKENNRRRKKKPGLNKEDLSPSETVKLDEKMIINHRLPKAKQQTNVVVDGYVPQGRLLGAYTTRGEGIAQAKTRPGGFADEPYLSAQLNSAILLPIHQDKRNYGKTWLIALGSFTGGRLWLESPVGSFPPPCAKEIAAYNISLVTCAEWSLAANGLRGSMLHTALPSRMTTCLTVFFHGHLFGHFPH